MADPKYSGLPGIAYDQPDVYETEDLPESERQYAETEYERNPAIEVLHLSSNEAVKGFRGKILNSEYVDFSDSISSKHTVGYRNRPIEYEIGGEENVVQKFQRLLAEVNNLSKEVQVLKGDIVHGGGKVSAVELVKQVEQLNSLLLNINLEKSLSKEIMSSISEPELALQKKLVNLLEGVKGKEMVSEKKQDGEKNPSEGSATITYELYYAPEHAKLSHLTKAAKLEQRLEIMEKVVGNNPDNLSTLSVWTNQKSLLDSVQSLSSRLSLLEPSHLDQVEARLHAVHTKMNNIAEKKVTIDEANKQSKVNELYELMKKSETLCTTLPNVVDRLICVESLHQDAMKFSQSLKELDLAQTKLNSTLQSNNQLLMMVQKKFTENLCTIKKNILAIDERVHKLPQDK